MDRKKFLNLYRPAVTVVGVLAVGYCIASLQWRSLAIGFLGVVLFAIFVAPRMSLVIPRSNVAIGFSDALIFLAFLLYGPEAAVVVACVETLANCLYAKWQGTIVFGRHMIAVNSAAASVSTFAACLVWEVIARFTETGHFAAETRDLVTTLGVLALMQFFFTTFFASVFRAMKEGVGLWTTWVRDCLGSSLSQIVGAGMAGIFYKILNFGDFVTAAVATVTFAIAYFTYRQSIKEINDAFARVEEAEQQKAETEKVRRLEAEHHAGQLRISLEKEERANQALRKSESDFQYAALHDPLTGLANRKHFGDILRSLIRQYRDDPKEIFQVLFLDIRRFKDINDTLGHTIGDKALTIVAKRFTRAVNEGDVVARIGGDEFAIILRNLSTVGKAQKVARKIYDAVTHPFSLSGNTISIDVNIGVAPCDAEYNTPEEILRDADIAMHHAKETTSGLAVFTRELRARFLERVRFEMDLRQAIDRNELAVNYQPIVSLRDGRLVGFEALMRWHHSEFGLIPPNKFVPIAEYSGLIRPLTVWILREACRQVSIWRKISPEYADLIVSVNISGKHLGNDDLIEDVESVLEATGLPSANLKLEITESTAMENAEHTIDLLKKLKNIGVQLSIDDFGTGYSSLSYLQRLPFDTLKIDRTFVYSVGENGENSEILQTIISLAKNLKMRVIAEGIETASQLSVLRNLGCDFGQGFLMAKPKNREATEQLLYEHRNFLPSPEAARDQESTSIDERLPVF